MWEYFFTFFHTFEFHPLFNPILTWKPSNLFYFCKGQFVAHIYKEKTRYGLENMKDSTMNKKYKTLLVEPNVIQIRLDI